MAQSSPGPGHFEQDCIHRVGDVAHTPRTRGSAGAPPLGEGADAALIYFGRAAWGRRQLEREISRGVWGVVADPCASEILDNPDDALWRGLRESGRVQWATH